MTARGPEQLRLQAAFEAGDVHLVHEIVCGDRGARVCEHGRECGGLATTPTTAMYSCVLITPAQATL
jgi:hypothetical protein